jgi:hypothetical protein
MAVDYDEDDWDLGVGVPEWYWRDVIADEITGFAAYAEEYYACIEKHPRTGGLHVHLYIRLKTMLSTSNPNYFAIGPYRPNMRCVRKGKENHNCIVECYKQTTTTNI